MGKLMVVLVGASLFALATPSLFERYRHSLLQPENQSVEQLAPPPPIVEASARPAPRGGRVERIRADASGHFRAQARLNGRPVDVLVDTGATAIAIDEDTARRIGIFVRPDEFRYTVQTANGERKVARALIDRVEIGQVQARNVEAAVLRGGGLSETLLGMSFLGKLDRYSVEGDTLDLVE
ncbi:retropepsin-like aspartic protease family protein [Consotaella aegiceratis]|uniref:retropepsin-like aspartic protease family protein n=1 Tax=Consotaella aegiceratis TaxID=3097961 RepID=UPI002F419B9F